MVAHLPGLPDPATSLEALGPVTPNFACREQERETLERQTLEQELLSSGLAARVEELAEQLKQLRENVDRQCRLAGEQADQAEQAASRNAEQIDVLTECCEIVHRSVREERKLRESQVAGVVQEVADLIGREIARHDADVNSGLCAVSPYLPQSCNSDGVAPLPDSSNLALGVPVDNPSCSLAGVSTEGSPQSFRVGRLSTESAPTEFGSPLRRSMLNGTPDSMPTRSPSKDIIRLDDSPVRRRPLNVPNTCVPIESPRAPLGLLEGSALGERASRMQIGLQVRAARRTPNKSGIDTVVWELSNVSTSAAAFRVAMTVPQSCTVSPGGYTLRPNETKEVFVTPLATGDDASASQLRTVVIKATAASHVGYIDKGQWQKIPSAEVEELMLNLCDSSGADDVGTWVGCRIASGGAVPLRADQ